MFLPEIEKNRQSRRLHSIKSDADLTSIHPIIVIPVYNGRDSLLSLIGRIESLGDHPILVIDDGSRDELTAEDVSPHKFYGHSENRGKGAALKTGLNLAAKLGYSHALTLDADGQHDPSEIDHFLDLAHANPGAFIIGMRDLIAESMPLHRKLSNNITSFMLSLRTSTRVRDSQVGYRCYPLTDSRLWDSIEDGFQFESAVYFNAAKLRIPLVWQPIPVIYGTEESHINPLKDTVRFVRMYIRNLIRI